MPSVEKMRILICTDPGTVHSQRFIESLGRKAKVALFWYGDKRDFSGYEIPCYPLLWKKPVKVRWFGRILQEFAYFSTIALFNPTLIHVHREAKWCKKFKQWMPSIPIVFTSCGHIPKNQLMGSWGQNLTFASGFTADSQSLLDELHSVPGCEHKPAQIFRFGVSEDAFQLAPPSQELKRKLAIPFDGKVIYSARSLRPGYNHLTLVKAMPIVLKSIPEAYFVFVNNHGHRYSDALEYKNQLQDEMEQLGVLSHCRFLEHMENRADLAILFQTSDVVVSIPVEDGFPATIFEAMACGSPLVISDLPDYSGVIDNSNAISIEPTDVRKLAGAITLILTDENVSKNLRIAGLKTIAIKGNMVSELDGLLDYFQIVIDEDGNH